jgi:hypothetical protein
VLSLADSFDLYFWIHRSRLFRHRCQEYLKNGDLSGIRH